MIGVQVSADYGPVEGGLPGVGLGLESHTAVQEEIDYAVAAVLAGPQEGALHLRVGGIRGQGAGGSGSGIREKTLDHVEAAQSGGSFEVQMGTADRQEFGGMDASVCEAGVDEQACSGMRGVESCTVVEEKLQERFLYAGPFGMEARRHQGESCRSAVDVGYGVDLGAGLEQEGGDLHDVFGSLLAVSFDAVGGDVVQEGRLMAARGIGLGSTRDARATIVPAWQCRRRRWRRLPVRSS